MAPKKTTPPQTQARTKTSEPDSKADSAKKREVMGSLADFDPAHLRGGKVVKVRVHDRRDK